MAEDQGRFVGGAMTRPPFSPQAEGTIRFELDFGVSPPPRARTIAELNAWRGLLYRLGLTGQDPRRYGGLAYGNVSQRESLNRFIISCTQTGGKEWLTSDDYCLVTDFDLEANRLCAEGQNPPSSEALTHAAIYAAKETITHVLHIHSPEIWAYHDRLDIPTTAADIAYGTPDMAKAVKQGVTYEDKPVICMLGHPDGVIAFGRSAEDTALCLLRCLAGALQLAWSDEETPA
jgi:hypothetical protein